MLFAAPASLEPGDVLNWFDLCNVGLAREEQEAFRLLGAGIEPPLPSPLFDVLGIGASRTDIRNHFTACRQELELVTLLTLTAAAEARIRLDALQRRATAKDELARRLGVLSANVRAEWQIPLYDDGIIAAWKTYIGSLPDLVNLDRARLLSAIGRFKNLLDVRHWVAHGRYWQIQRGIEHYPPTTVADIVSDLYDALRSAANHRSLMAFS